jgi:peptidoglycan/LPS O-acetylase OafA/YrhL
MANARPGGSAPAGHLAPLDGLRGLAIVAVMLRHFLGWQTAHGGISRALVGASSLGWLGVDLFFVLSGFLITGILLRAKGDPHYLRNFYMRRLLRIFPLYYAALVVLFVVLPRFVPVDDESRLTYARQGWLWLYGADFETCLRGSFDFDHGWFHLSHFWSLSVEEHFYLVWPFLVLAVSERMLARVAVGIAVIALLLRTALVLDHVFTGTIYVLTFCRMDALAIGALLAVVAREPRRLAAWQRRAPWVLAGAALYVAAIAAWKRSDAGWHWSMQTVGYSIADLGSAALVTLALAPAPFPGNVLSSRVLRAFGKYSYGAYVIHSAALPLFERYLFGPVRAAVDSEPVAFVLYASIAVALSMGAAVLSWSLFEKPILSLKRYFEYAPAPTAPAATFAAKQPSLAAADR